MEWCSRQSQKQGAHNIHFKLFWILKEGLVVWSCGRWQGDPRPISHNAPETVTKPPKPTTLTPDPKLQYSAPTTLGYCKPFDDMFTTHFKQSATVLHTLWPDKDSSSPCDVSAMSSSIVNIFVNISRMVDSHLRIVHTRVCCDSELHRLYCLL